MRSVRSPLTLGNCTVCEHCLFAKTSLWFVSEEGRWRRGIYASVKHTTIYCTVWGCCQFIHLPFLLASTIVVAEGVCSVARP